MAPMRNRLSNTPHTHDANTLARHMQAQHLGWVPPGPVPRTHRPLALCRAPRRHQHEHHTNIRRGIGHGPGRVGHDNARRFGGRHIDMIKSHAKIRQHFAARLRHIGKHGGGVHITQGRQHRIVVSKAQTQFCITQRQSLRPHIDMITARMRRRNHRIRQRARNQNPAQCNRPPSGTSRSGFANTIAPSASGKPRTSTSDIKGPIWRAGKFTTAKTCWPTKVSGA
mmetsp:Transcript_23469/g.41257  ORF Transcript_23469/g.41257 Transcript_23469/m.41257 type:complete len:225 (-) Transcript_23469:2102-2776(-)